MLWKFQRYLVYRKTHLSFHKYFTKGLPRLWEHPHLGQPLNCCFPPYSQEINPRLERSWYLWLIQSKNTSLQSSENAKKILPQNKASQILVAVVAKYNIGA